MINKIRNNFRMNNVNMLNKNLMNVARGFDDSSDSRYTTLPHYWSIL